MTYSTFSLHETTANDQLWIFGASARTTIKAASNANSLKDWKHGSPKRRHPSSLKTNKVSESLGQG
jgi:hypothetical protein